MMVSGRKITWLIAGLFGLLVLSSCVKSGKGTSNPCTNNSECPDGAVCYFGVCVTNDEDTGQTPDTQEDVGSDSTSTDTVSTDPGAPDIPSPDADASGGTDTSDTATSDPGGTDTGGQDAGETDTACTPSCEGKTCGDDGCGGSCGDCLTCDGTPDELLCIGGTCMDLCCPNCEGLDCGSDGCGGTCGFCEAPFTCNDETQLCTCTPQCAGLSCGPDGCGGECGACSSAEQCLDGQCICIPNCTGKECGDSGCGTSCGTCGIDEVCQESQCITVLPEDTGPGDTEDTTDVEEPVDEGTDIGEDTYTPFVLPPPIACATDTQCPSLQTCDTVSGYCQSSPICISHLDCAESWCDHGTCSTEDPACADGDDCAAGGVCHAQFHICIDAIPCSSGSDCLSGHCDIFDHTCQECLSDSHCPTGRPFCNQGRCIHLGSCTTDDNCDPGIPCITGQCLIPLPAEDYLENNDTAATAISVLTADYIDLTIHPTDPDYYHYQIPADQSLLVAVNGENPFGQLSVQIIDEATGFVLDARNHATTFSTMLVPAADTPRNVLILVENPAGQVGTYVLKVALTSKTTCMPDAGDYPSNNDILGKAEDLGGPHVHLLSRGICPSDTDWYKTTVGEDQELLIWLWAEPGTDPPIVGLRDSAGTVVALAEELGQHRYLRMPTLAPGDYYITVLGSPVGESRRYSLKVDRWDKLECSLDPHEFDDLVDFAAVQPSIPPALTLCTDDVDNFLVSVNADEGLQVTLNYNNYFSTLKMDLLDPVTETLVAQEIGVTEPKGDQVIEILLPADPSPRDFIVQVSRIEPEDFVGQTGYTVTAQPLIETCIDDDHEPNDDFGAATSAGGGQPQQGQYCSNNADWFLFNTSLAPNDRVTVDAIQPAGSSPLILEFLDPTGENLIASGVGTEDQRGVTLTHTLAADAVSGKYTVKVTGLQASPYVLYPIRVGEANCPDDPEEPDDTPLTARQVLNGTPLTGSLCQQNSDMAYLVLDDGPNGTLQIDAVKGEGASIIKIFIYLWDENLEPKYSNKIQTSGDSGSHSIDMDALGLEPGMYYLNLYPFKAATYTVSW
ncbi:MAG: hypothetical protein CMH54_09590 [Myxococcales bacterium]|nr:hypothetical protein [Myxococcales bacterium]